MKPLSYAVRLVQNDLGEGTQERYQQYLQWAIDAYHELAYKVLKGVEVEYFKPNANGIAKLPPDYNDYTKVGVIVNGEVINLSLNNNMAKRGAENPYTERLCPEDVSAATTTMVQTGCQVHDLYDGRTAYAGHWRNGMWVGEMYGYGGGYNEKGYFYIDKKRGIIQFQNVNLSSELIMEYTSDGKVSEGTLVDIQAARVVQLYVHWMRIENVDTVPLSEKERKKNQFEKKLEDYKVSASLPTFQDYMDYWVDASTLSYG